MQCHTCRKRRVRCDGALPACQKCRDRGPDCLGYGKQKPLVWLAGGGHQNAFLDDRQKARKKGRPRLIVDKEVDKEKEKDRDVVVQKAIPESMMFAYPAEIQKVVRTIWYYEHELVPDLDPINHVDFKAAEDPTAWQDDLASVLWHVLICAVDTHKAIRSQPDSTSRQAELQVGREVYRSKSHTLRRISRNLADPETRIADVTLVGVLTLFMAETQLSAVGSWQTHFEGACHIVRMRGGVGAIARHSAGLNSLLTFFMMLTRQYRCDELHYYILVSPHARRKTAARPSIYHAATAIYCVRSLGHLLDPDQLLHVSFSPTSTASYVSMSDILLVARKILLEKLREVLLTVSDPRKSFVKVMLWPMFVAGVEAAIDSQPETVQFRSLLESVLRRLCRSLGTLSICGLRNFLLSLWEHTKLHPHLWSWSELMALSPGRSIFFM
ncbi:C6 transcription factor [Trichophyton tonsurans CBS 112818]|uniref:C6 transcription factor n=1 Tax=Trichophyton tonsurans (strain CBS 112818) TaxID=647933 RepID=F2S767_TRIT1|nr:C6 transcription factor [Trichophyton tonsurans CBS 112818]